MTLREWDVEGPAVVQYWHSEEIPADVAAEIATFRDLNPDLRHFTFSEESAEGFIGERFGPRELAAFRACAAPAMQSDYLRYCAGIALGGVCVDADVRCRRPLRPLIEQAVDGGLLFRWPHGQVVSGFFAFNAPGHPILRLALDVSTANIEQRASKSVWSVTGPWIFTALEALHRLGSNEAFRQEVAKRGMKASQEPLLEAVGDGARLREAFAGVRILAREEAMRWIGKPGKQLAYKQGDKHWASRQRRGSIFRTP